MKRIVYDRKPRTRQGKRRTRQGKRRTYI